MKNVIREIVDKELCSGCGVCAAVCPRECLKMVWSATGELNPRLSGECTGKCDLCLRVCPFSGHGEDVGKLSEELFGDLPGIARDTVVGPYLSCHVGYSLLGNERAAGSSGGMASWFLRTMLERGLVDGVITALPDLSPQTDRLFRYSVLTDAAQIPRSAGSKYYPMEISSAIWEILGEEEDRKYAVIGLPCLLFGLTKARRLIPKLRKRVVYTLALVCGMLPGRFYSELLSEYAGIPANHVQTLEYRIKTGTERAGNYAAQATDRSGRRGKKVYCTELPFYLWDNGFFIHRCCGYCDDVFGESADAAFMDAWLPEYEPDARGHNLMVLRDPELQELLLAGRDAGDCHCDPIGVERVRQSQARAIWRKKHLIRGNLHHARTLKGWTPARRVNLSLLVHLCYRHYIANRSLTITESKRLWAECTGDNRYAQFWDKSAPLRSRLEKKSISAALGRRLDRLIRRFSRSSFV